MFIEINFSKLNVALNKLIPKNVDSPNILYMLKQMNSIFFLLTFCLFFSCSRSNKNAHVDASHNYQTVINDFVPNYIIEIPNIKLSEGEYRDYQIREYIVNGTVDRAGFKQGVWNVNDIRNKLEFQGRFLNDKKNGWWQVLSESKLTYCGNYELNKKQGFWRYFKLNNETMKFVIYVNDTLTGLAREFTSDSVLLSDGNYSKGLKEGYWKFYNRNGALTQQGYYHEGLKSGWWQRYDSNTKLSEEASHSMNEIAGYVKRYINGVISEEGNEFNSKKRGSWKYYDLEGKLKNIQEYEE